MGKAPAFQYYAKDHIATKASLTMEERGAWSTLVDHCWENGAPISMEVATRLVGQKQMESLRFLLRIDGDLVTFDWIEETRKKQAERSLVNSTNGGKGGRGNKRGTKRKSERKANAYRNKRETKPFRAEDANEDTSTQEGKERAKGPNPQVQAVIDHLTEALKAHDIAPSLDGSEKDNRFAAANLVRKLAKDYPDFDPVDSAKRLIDFATTDAFHGRNSTNVGYLFRNVGKIAADAKAQKTNPKTMTDEQYRNASKAEAERRFGGR